MNTQIDITQNGTTTLATAGKYCDRDIDVNTKVPTYEAELAEQKAITHSIIGRTIVELVDNDITVIGKNAFTSSASLKKVDFASVTHIGSAAFSYCYQLTTVILRNPTVCTLYNTNAFTSCHHFSGNKQSQYNPDGLKDGYIYVPDELVESYKTATNWATFADQIKPISELEE